MAYFAVFDIETGRIENLVECPEFLANSIHLDENQDMIQVESQVSATQYHVVNRELYKLY
jgi:hypothetical protein